MKAKTASNVTLSVISSMGEITREDWNACANPVGTEYNPFISHDFLSCLEELGAATADTGWLAQHLVLDGADGKPAAILPCYLKSHSQGEYVFDHGWAEAFERAGGRYYPKLQCSVPFTPVTGRRLLIRSGVSAEGMQNILCAGAVTLAERHGVSSLHATFLPRDEWETFAAAGFLQRTDRQFHFLNDGYSTFDDFLDDLASRKRKAIRRERRDALAGDVAVEHLTGNDLTEAAWDAFFGFYIDTGSRKWGRPYLNRRFFSLVGERMRDKILLTLARRSKRPIAGALNFIGSHALYGRYWGAVEEQPFLHFELCYYQAIEWAIDHKLPRVEAGAQGEHKLARGYRPTTTYSAHWIANASFRRAVADYLKREQRVVEADSNELAEFLPFRMGEEPTSAKPE